MEDNQFQVINEEIPQDRIEPTETEAPEIAQAASENVAPQLSSATTSSVIIEQQQQQQKRYTEELQARNFAEMRRIQDQKDRELDLMRREIEQLRQMQSKPQSNDLPKDALAEVHQVERIVSSALKEQEERYKRQFEEQRRIEAERTLNVQYKDLYQVLSQENLRRLEIEEPEIAASIAANPDTYSAKVAAYKQIKKLGISEDNYNAQRVQERLNQNQQRPKNPAAIAPRQGSQALSSAPPQTGFAESITEDMAARYRKEMEEAISRM